MAWDSHPQSARGYVYLLQPTIVFKARVNLASATYPVAEIPFDGVTVGAYGDIEIGQTVLIGSTEGAYDLGRTYVRKAASSSVLYIGFSSRGGHVGEVTLTDNAYITVVDTYEVWRKPQRLDNSAGVIYKDYELAYNTATPPIVHVGDLGGLGRIGMTSGGVLTVDALDWGGSTLVNAADTWSSRTWDMADGTITVGTTTSQAPDVTFPAGKRWVTLTGVTAAGGTARRRYLVVALDPADPDIIRATNVRYRRTAEGQTMSCDLKERLDPANYLPGTVVMLLVRESRGGTVTWAQRFAGWLDIESSFAQASITLTDKGTTIQAVDVAGKLAQVKALAAAFENEASMSSWLHMVGCNPERMMHRLLEFESTALTVADFALTGLSGSAAYPVMSWNVTGGNMYDTVDGLARAFGRRFTCNSNGKLALKTDPMRQNIADRTATVQRLIDEAGWKRLNWQTRARPTTGALTTENAVISSGYASTLSGGGLAPFPDVYSVAPGEVAGQGIGESSGGREIVQSQTESNERAGHDYARMNGDPLYSVELAHGVDADIEPADMTWVNITASQGNAGYRGPTLSGESGLPVTVDVAINSETGVSTQVLTWERETSGEAGARDPRPATSNAGYSGSVNVPVPGNGVTRSASGLGLIADLALFDQSNQLILMANTLDLLAGGTPETEIVALSLTGTLCAFAVRADSPKYVDGTGAVNGYLATTSQVRTIDDIFDAQTLGTAQSFTATNTAQVQLQVERGDPDNAVVMRYRDSAGSAAHYTDDGGATWTASTGLTTHYDTNYLNTTPNWVNGLYADPRGNGKWLTSCHTSTASPPGADFYESSDKGATWAAKTSSGYSLDRFNARCIVRPLLRPDDVAFFGEHSGSSPNSQRLYRIIGSTREDISPQISTDIFGVPSAGFQRGISVADDNPAALMLIGQTNTGLTGKWAVLQTFNALDAAGSIVWNTVIDVATNVGGAPLWTGGYYVTSTLMFLYGTGGRFAIARWENGAWAVYETTISGAGTIVGICGG